MNQATDAAFAVSYTSRRVIVLGDTPRARTIASDVVEQTGAGLVACLPIEAGADRLPERHAAAVILVEVDSDDADALVPLLDRLEEEAVSGRPSVIVVPRALLDVAAARAGHREIAILCEPGPVDRTAALALALASPGAHLHDVNTDANTARLRQLSEEVSRIARTLASLSAEGTDSAGRAARSFSPSLSDVGAAGEPGAPAISPATIRTMIRLRRLRGQFFDPTLFADPAWDILLDLAAAQLEGVPVAVSSLCIAAAVPPTTALRWIKTLTDAGLLVRHADARDGRRVFIQLSDQAATAMMGYLALASKSIAPLG